MFNFKIGKKNIPISIGLILIVAGFAIGYLFSPSYLADNFLYNGYVDSPKNVVPQSATALTPDTATSDQVDEISRDKGGG